MVKMRAVQRFGYANRALRPGDEFNANRRDADLLTRIGRAEYAEGRPAQSQRPSQQHTNERQQQRMAEVEKEAMAEVEKEVLAAQEPEEPVREPAQEPVRSPLDHDGDGRKGGSKAGEESTRAQGRTKAALAKQYEEATGEKPDGRWSKETLEKRLAGYNRRDMRAKG